MFRQPSKNKKNTYKTTTIRDLCKRNIDKVVKFIIKL